MPALQIIFETIHQISPKGFALIPHDLINLVVYLISLLEIFARLSIRLSIIPHIFPLVALVAIVNGAFIISSIFLTEITKPFDFHSLPRKTKPPPDNKVIKNRSLFSPATSVANVIVKTWLISDYCYDRFVLHAPLCLYNLAFGNAVHKYQYRPRGVFSRSYKYEEDAVYKLSQTKTSANLDYTSKLRAFNLHSNSTSPERLLPKPRKPISPSDILMSDRYKVSANVSPLQVMSTNSNLTFNTPEKKEINDQSQYDSPEYERPLSKSQSLLTPDKKPGSSVRIRFSKRNISGGSFVNLHKTRRWKNKKEGDENYFDYGAVKEAIRQNLVAPDGFDDGSFGPIFVRLAWHTSATYDKTTDTGGSNGGTMRFPPELTDDSNTGLHTALIKLEAIKQKFPWISYGDLWTLGGVTALEEMGCVPIKWLPGRVDCVDNSKVPPNGRLPLAYLGSDHIREVFTTRLGFDDREAVLLIGGGHSLGRCHTKYSGWDGKWTENPIHFSNRFFTALLDEKWEWSKVPSTGREQFFNREKNLMMLNTDMELIRDPEFRKWSEYYGNDNQAFLNDFAEVFAKLIELGVPR